MIDLRSVVSWLVPCLLLVPAVACARIQVNDPIPLTEAETAAPVRVEEATPTEEAPEIEPEVSEPETAPAIITELSEKDLFQVLATEGLVPERLEENIIQVKMDMYVVTFFVWENRKSIQAFAGFRNTNTSLEKINEWNRGTRFSTAYIDGDGDPVIELDLDLDGGITRERLVDFLRTVRWSVVEYRKHVFD